MIIDAHAHLSTTSYGNIQLYIDQLKEAGIERGIVVPGGMMDVRKMTEYVTGKSKPENTIPDNVYIKLALENHPCMLTGFACIDPHSPTAVEDLNAYFKNGYRGLKLSPMTHEFSFASKKIAQLVELCGEWEYPVYTHVVFSPGASTSKLVHLAKQFPNTNFILGHMGFGPADTEAVEGAKLDNFFLETSMGSYLLIQEAIQKVGAGKIIFGSEFPLSHPKVELQKILVLTLSDDEKDKILGKNISQLLHAKFSGFSN